MNSSPVTSFTRIFCCWLLLAPELICAEAYLNGRVTDTEGNPVYNATLWICTYEVKTFTDKDGYYRFPQIPPDIGVRRLPVRKGTVHPTIRNNVVSFTVPENGVWVRCELLDLKGRCVLRPFNGFLQSSVHTLDLKSLRLPASAYIVSLTVGKLRYTGKIVVQKCGGVQVSEDPESIFSLRNPLEASLSTESETYIDYLNCLADGYENVTVPLVSYLGTINLEMEVEDITPPVIQVLEGDTVRIHYTDTVTLKTYWTDLRIQVSDDRDSAPILYPPTNTLIDRSVPSLAVIKYQAKDRSENIGIAYRYLVLYDTVMVDTVPPVISVDPDTVYLSRGEFFNDTGVTAFDAIDSMVQLSSFIARDGEVDVETPGIYRIVYRVIDTSMNLGTAVRIVTVEGQNIGGQSENLPAGWHRGAGKRRDPSSVR